MLGGAIFIGIHELFFLGGFFYSLKRKSRKEKISSKMRNFREKAQIGFEFLRLLWYSIAERDYSAPTAEGKEPNTMENKGGKTTRFTSSRSELTPREVLMTVYSAMKEKGYDPVNQIVGYLLSGDPTYITSYKNARYLILRVERDELLEELVRFYARRQSREGE